MAPSVPSTKRRSQQQQQQQQQKTAFEKKKIRSNSKLTPTQARKLRRRAKCKINQQRYRERKKAHEEQLYCTVQSLRNEIHAMEGDIRHRYPQTIVQAIRYAKKYFHVFQKGYDNHEARIPHPQETFLLETMVPNVKHGQFVGIGSFIDQWKLFSAHVTIKSFTLTNYEIIETNGNGSHRLTDAQLNDLQKKTSNLVETHNTDLGTSPLDEAMNEMKGKFEVMVRAKAQMQVSITEERLQQMFPNVASNSDFRDSLVKTDQYLTTLVHFYFTKDSRVSRIDTSIDYFTCFLKLVKDPEELLPLLEDSNIAADSFLIDNRKLKPLIYYHFEQKKQQEKQEAAEAAPTATTSSSLSSKQRPHPINPALLEHGSSTVKKTQMKRETPEGNEYLRNELNVSKSDDEKESRHSIKFLTS